MKTWQLAVVGLACLAIAGCRTDPNIDLLERDLRLQEDEIYRLEDCIEEHRSALEACRRENAVLRRQSGLGPSDSDSSAEVDLPRETAELDAPCASAPLQPPLVQLPGQAPPDAEPPGSPSVPGHFLTASAPLTPGLAPVRESPGGGEDGDETAARATGIAGPIVPADGRQVTQVVLNGLLTGGYDADGRAGDEGITVVIEPRDAHGRWIEAPADVCVVVLDPAAEGEAARVARWDLTAAETAGRFRTTGLGRGIELNLLWPAASPVHEELHLYVRYTTSDGRKLEVDGPIRIELPGGRSPGWLPAEPAQAELQAGRPAQYGEAPTTSIESSAPAEAGSSPAGSLPEADHAPDPLSPRPVATLPGTQPNRPVWSPHRR